MKKPCIDLPVVLGSHPFFFSDVGFLCAWMNSCVTVTADDGNGGMAQCGPFVAFYTFVPVAGGVRRQNVCVRLISPKRTIFLVLEQWPGGSTVLSVVHLVDYLADGSVKRGKRGTVMWTDQLVQDVVSYEVLHPTCDEMRLWRFAKYMYELSRPSVVSGDAGNVRPVRKGTYERQRAAVEAAGRIGNDSAAALCEAGPGYLVNGRFLISADYRRVRALDGCAEPWSVQPFTQRVLRVLVENGDKPGLTTDLVYARAKALYLDECPEARGDAPGCSKVPVSKSVGQFFRLTRKGERTTHPLYEAIVVKGRHDAEYVLPSEWVDADDPRLFVCCG